MCVSVDAGSGDCALYNKKKQKERGCLSGAHGRAMTKRHARGKTIKTGQE